MPELPEVETSRRGIEPFLKDQVIDRVVVRDRRLRWPVARGLEGKLANSRISAIDRRAKYLLIRTSGGIAMIHLGMSGSVFIVDVDTPAGVHDHFDIELRSGRALRYRDPRRFGSLHLTKDETQHPLIRDLGPEPLSDAFDTDYLYKQSRGRRVAIKPFIMNASVVVGVGNIYASEALFAAGIHPRRAAGRVSHERYSQLVDAIKAVLARSIEAGGTTLRDFYGGDGEAGYFQQELSVYGREDEPCRTCNTPLTAVVLGQRATYYCKRCQR